MRRFFVLAFLAAVASAKTTLDIKLKDQQNYAPEEHYQCPCQQPSYSQQQQSYGPPQSCGPTYQDCIRRQQEYGKPYQQNGQSYQQNGQSYKPNGQAYQQNGQYYQPNGQSYQQNGQSYQENYEMQSMPSCPYRKQSQSKAYPTAYPQQSCGCGQNYHRQSLIQDRSSLPTYSYEESYSSSYEKPYSYQPKMYGKVQSDTKPYSASYNQKTFSYPGESYQQNSHSYQDNYSMETMKSCPYTKYSQSQSYSPAYSLQSCGCGQNCGCGRNCGCGQAYQRQSPIQDRSYPLTNSYTKPYTNSYKGSSAPYPSSSQPKAQSYEKPYTASSNKNTGAPLSYPGAYQSANSYMIPYQKDQYHSASYKPSAIPDYYQEIVDGEESTSYEPYPASHTNEYDAGQNYEKKNDGKKSKKPFPYETFYQGLYGAAHSVVDY